MRSLFDQIASRDSDAIATAEELEQIEADEEENARKRDELQEALLEAHAKRKRAKLRREADDLGVDVDEALKIGLVGDPPD